MTRHAEFAAEKLTLLKSPAPRILGMSIFVFLVRAYTYIYKIPCAHVSIYIHMCTHVHIIYIYTQYIDYLWFWNMLMIVINRSSAKLAFGHHPKSRLQNRGVTEIDWDVAARVFSSDWCFAAFLRPKHGIPLKLCCIQITGPHRGQHSIHCGTR